MKFLKTDGDQLVFQLGRREKDIFSELLKMYPVVPTSHHRISQETDSPAGQANQALLEEALTDHRKEKKLELEAMMADPARFQQIPGGSRLRLTAYELEWLLQVLNDVRVGCWLNLGSPDEKLGTIPRLNAQNAHNLWAMELCGHFEACFLAALEQS